MGVGEALRWCMVVGMGWVEGGGDVLWKGEMGEGGEGGGVKKKEIKWMLQGEIWETEECTTKQINPRVCNIVDILVETHLPVSRSLPMR